MVQSLIPSLYNVMFPKCAIVGALLLIALMAAFDGLCFLLDPDLRRQSNALGIFLIVISAIPWIVFIAWLSWFVVKRSWLVMRPRRHPLLGFGRLVLWVTVSVLWSRGRFYVDYLVDGSGPWRWIIVANHGIVEIGRSRANGTPPGLQWTVIPAVRFPKYPQWFFYVVHNPSGWAIGIPLWFCEIVSAALFAISFRRRRTPLEGFCRKCGYDLRATPDRCPECGTASLRPEITPPNP